MMNSLGNILWILLGGWLVFLLYLFGSLLLFLTIVGIPFGIQTLKLASLGLLPFGKEVRTGQHAGGCLYLVMNIFWLLVAGIELALVHVLFALLFALTIIGIPFAQQHIKLAVLALTPFGHNIAGSSSTT